MERLKGFVQRRLPLLIGLILVALALVFVAPRVMAWLPWSAVATQPAAPPPAAAAPGLPNPAVGAAPMQPAAPPAAGPRLPEPVVGAGSVQPIAPPPPAAEPQPPHAEPAGPPPPRPGAAWGGWLLGWLLGTPRQWISIVLIIGGLWLLGRRQVQYTPRAVTVTETVYPETYQPAQEA